MRIEFINLNKAYPKDSYPLLKIYQLVDKTARHKLLTFTKEYSEYNWIHMHPSDQQHIPFITDNVSSTINLNNVKSTYQRIMVDAMFARQIGLNMELYVDDVLVKSNTSNDHFTDLEEVFEVLDDTKWNSIR